MKLSEIAEYVVEKYPDCCMSANNNIKRGCREEWYEEYLIDLLMDFFAYEIVGMCGCGCPEDTQEVIRRILNILNDRDNEKIKYEAVRERYKTDLELNTSNNLDYGLLQFVLYILDDKEILEHGGSIGGCWVANLGKMYLTVLNAWHDQQVKEK